MTVRRRVVFDTNAVISRLLRPNSVPAQAVRLAMAEDQVIVSEETMMGLAGVLSRRKFDLYISLEKRKEFLRLFGRVVEHVQILHVLRACRDPKDDKFLELAVNGQADVVVSGDAELLVLHPFRDIPILTPAAFVGATRVT